MSLNKNRNNIKVLHIITEMHVGGAQDNTLLSVKGLKELGYQVDLASSLKGAWAPLAQEYADQVFDIPSFEVNELSLFGNIKAFFEVYSLLKNQRYDIIHTHSTTAGLIGRFAAKLLNIPLIIHTVHGFAFHDYMSPLKINFLVWLEKMAALCCHRMITVCDLNLQEVMDRQIAPADKLITIYSGINLKKFEGTIDQQAKRRELGLEHDHYKVVGTVGRLSYQKNPLDFVKAAKRVLEKLPETYFIMVGDGPLRQEAEEAIVGDERIKILGTRHDIPEILKIFDVFALSSIYEGLGRALTEAMICKIPVVATAVNGVPELVTDGKNGFLVPPYQPELLAQKIIELLSNEALRQEFIQQGYNRVVPEFSADLMVQKIDVVYQEEIQTRTS